jgi:hypothetical protein
VLPIFPALSFLTAHAIAHCAGDRPISAGNDDFYRPVFRIAAGIWAVAAVALSVAPWMVLPWLSSTRLLPLIVFTTIGIASGIVPFVLIFQKRLARAFIAMGLGSAVCVVLLYTWLVPSLAFITAPRDVGLRLRELGGGGSTPVAMVDFREPSLAFYQGGGAREQEEGDIVTGLKQNWLVVSREAWLRVPPDVQARYVAVDPPRRVFMLAGSLRITDILILHKKPE